jgi:hypothetical protein
LSISVYSSLYEGVGESDEAIESGPLAAATVLQLVVALARV